MVDGDPDPGAVEPHAAFYGLWPKFADPAGCERARSTVPPADVLRKNFGIIVDLVAGRPLRTNSNEQGDVILRDCRETSPQTVSS